MSRSQEADIVVGVDESESSRAALVFALREAARRGSAVEVVTAWTFDGGYDHLSGREWAELPRVAAQRVQDEAVTAALATVPAPPLVSRTVIEGDAGPVLLHAAREAAYLVVGSARKNAVQRAVLGSTSRDCVQHASVPVMVIHRGARVPPTVALREPAAEARG